MNHPSVAHPSVTYPVSDIFHTIQGEGHFVGYPMTFVRLAGCSLWGTGACSIAAACDTEPTKLRERLDADAIVARVYAMTAPARGIVLLTGGEPTDHDLVPLLSALRDFGYRVHLETSGQKSIMGLPFEWITVSPKSPDYKQRIGHTLKIVVRPGTGWTDVDILDVGTQFLHRYLQPLTDAATGAVINGDEVIDMVRDVRRNRDAYWALSWQAHRTWGVR